MMWEALRRKNFLDKKFRRQHPLAGFILDFYCPALKVAIEIDGSVHANSDSQKYDKIREKIIKEHGIIIIRIKSEDVENNIQKVLSELEVLINHLPSPSKMGRGKGER